ncbi:unnamed protein product [Prunus brigantina]
MKIISWNVRGLGSKRKRVVVKDQLLRLNPDIVILQETKKEVFDRRLAAGIWGSRFKEWVYAPSRGRSGGIVVMWNSQTISISDFEIGEFSVSIRIVDGSGGDWWLSGIYGPCHSRDRRIFWEELAGLFGLCGNKWCIGWDFNVVRFVSEKSNGGRMTSSMKNFNDFIGDTNLRDPHLLNVGFTWSNLRENAVCRRLDRFLFFEAWEDFFPQKMKDWNKEVFGDVEGQGGLDNILRKEREELYFLVSDLAYKEEVKWRQRGKIQWARDGDNNTKFFHRSASGRRKRNLIHKLEVEGSGEVVSEREIELEIINFFKKLYSSNEEAGWCLVGLIWNAISGEEAVWLERPFEEEEVKRAVFDCGTDKSPGPDGFSMLLFQSCWDILKEDLMKVMKDFFNCGIINAITNETFLCLIPKKKESIKVSDFRPISLVTSLYKVVSKVLASRLREVLGSTISCCQVLL